LKIIIKGEVERQQLHNLADYIPIGSVVSVEDGGKMSKKQRGSLHVWCKQLADTLNDAGLYRVILSPINRREIEIPWTLITVKEDIYKPVLQGKTKKDSTEKQSTVEPSEVVLIVSKHFGEVGVICPPWPCR